MKKLLLMLVLVIGVPAFAHPPMHYPMYRPPVYRPPIMHPMYPPPMIRPLYPPRLIHHRAGCPFLYGRRCTCHRGGIQFRIIF